MTSPAKKKRRVNWRALNALVYCLVVLAVFLGVVAAWRRYSQRRRPVEPSSELGDAVERRIEAFKPNLGFANSWTKTGGPPQYTPAVPMHRFACSQCQSSCWMRSGGRCPACPFCGRMMTQQETGPNLAVAGGWSQAGGLPQDTPAASMCRFFCSQCQRSFWMCAVGKPPACPFCGRMMTQQETGPSPAGPVGWNQAGRLPRGTPAAPMCRFYCAQCQYSCWMRPGNGPPVCPFCGLLMDRQESGLSPMGGAPAMTPHAVRPTLIKEFGMEVRPAPGAGVKVTGVMGNSHASNAGLRAGDIIIELNGSKVHGIEPFQRSVSRAAPETDAQMTVLRSGRTRDLLVMVGEGEMEGVGPIQRP